MAEIQKMKTQCMKLSLSVIVIGFLLFGIQFQSVAQSVDPNSLVQGQPNNNSNQVKAKYAQGRFIVKFKSTGPAALNGDAQHLLKSNGSFQGAVPDRSDSLDKLNQKHKVKSAWSLFIERNGLTTAEAIQKQNNGQQLSRAMHQARDRRAPANAVMPDLSNVYVVEVPASSDIEAVVQEFQSDSHVEYAQPDYIMETTMVPNDPYYSSSGSWGQNYDDLWGLKKIQAEQAWDITQGEGVVVAVVDTGVDYNHPDIAANIWTNPGEIPDNNVDDDANGYVDDVRGWDLTTCPSPFLLGIIFPGCLNNDPMDKMGHGTHVAGIIAAVGNNDIGIIGVAPKAKIMVVKVMEGGNGSLSMLASGIIYAAQNGADVINNSWGCTGGCPSNPVAEDAVRTAYALGAVVVFGAGNDTADISQYSPQNMTNPKPVVVAAVDHLDQWSDFSNFGTLADVAAPGGDSEDSPVNSPFRNILSLRASSTDVYGDGMCIVNAEYYRARGTSTAAPYASGVAALVLAHHPMFHNEWVRQVLRSSADDVMNFGFDTLTGAGRVNAARAVTITLTGLDLVITSVSGPVGAVGGDNVTLNFEVKNQGIDGAPDGFGMGFYLSSDGGITTSDIFLGARLYGGLNAGGTFAGAVTVPIPRNLSEGTYYVGAVIDHDNSIAETDETNNWLAGNTVTVTGVADLVMTQLRGPASAVNDEDIVLNFDVANQGTGSIPAGGFSVGFALFPADGHTLSPYTIGSKVYSGGLNPASSFNDSVTVKIPISLPLGTYSFGAIVDYGDRVPESDESNNFVAGNAVDVGSARDLLLNHGAVSGTMVYRALNSIIAGPAFDIEGTADVTFKAGTVIILKPGFRTWAGAKFRAVPNLN